MVTVDDTDTAGYKWAVEAVQSISDTKLRADALEAIERGVKRWRGENVPGDYVGDTIWQIIQNVASAQGIDISDEASPLVRKLRIAELLLAMILLNGFSRTVNTFWLASALSARRLDTFNSILLQRWRLLRWSIARCTITTTKTRNLT